MEIAVISDAPVDSQRLESAIRPAADGGLLRQLHTFWLLQPGTWLQWLGIWTLQNVRFAPIYILPLLTGKLIDAIDRSDPSKATSWMPLIVGATLGLCLANVVGDTGARFLLSRITRGLTAGLRDALIRRLNRLNFTFHDREKIGEIETRFTLDMNRLEAFLGFLADGVLMNATVIVVMACIIYSTNPVLLPLIAVGTVLNLVLARLLWRRLRNAQESFRVAEGTFLNRLGETLLGMRMTRAHATEDFAEERIRTDAREVARRGIVLDFLINLFGSSSWAIGTLLSAVVTLLGVWLVVSPERTWAFAGMSYTMKPITLGELTVLLSYYGIMTGALAAIVNHVPTVSGAHDALRSLSRLYRDETEESPRGGLCPERIDGRITLQDVTFAYPGRGRPALEGLKLDIPAGSSLALVGPSGGGKSTVASLALGFYRPQRGKVQIDGQDLAGLDLRHLRRHVGVVNQDVVLFNDTILNNIAWGDRTPDEERARHAAELANATEFISRFPEGLHHVLGDRGSGLSGGQRQRLAIARALYRDPRILILDEATSALDQASERHVQVALQQAMRGRTTIIIAHRLSTIRDVDRVAVVADGRIVESGTYDELAAGDGPFAALIAGNETVTVPLT